MEDNIPELETADYASLREDSYSQAEAIFNVQDEEVRVRVYETKEVYSWRTDDDFRDIIQSVEPTHPLRDPEVECVREKGRIRNTNSDYLALDGGVVYDPVRHWEGKEERWEDYTRKQLNVSEGNVVLDREHGREDLVRVFTRKGETDLFENLFRSLKTDLEDKEELFQDSESFIRSVRNNS